MRILVTGGAGFTPYQPFIIMMFNRYKHIPN